jgi:cation:H+ antiporter
MIWLMHISIFCASIWAMRLSSEWLIGGLMRLSKTIGVKEFIVGFFVMAIASSLPNLFVGITSASRGIPELSLGDVFGNNFVAMTLAVFFAIWFAKKKEIGTGGKTVQTTAVFTMVSALLPIILIFDGNLSRTDGVILIGLFFTYVFWLLSKKEMFSKIYTHAKHEIQSGLHHEMNSEMHSESRHDLHNITYPNTHHNTHHNHIITPKIRHALRDFFLILTGVGILVGASVGIVFSASFLASSLGVPILIVGLLITGLGNALPEIYFAVASAKRNETQLIIGNLMGSVIFPATLVLGIVALIHPIESAHFEFAATINLNEGLILLMLYIMFVAVVVFG